MEIIKRLLDLVNTPEKTKGLYIYPFKHPQPKLVPTENDPRTHKGPYKGAIDFIFEPGTEVLAAADGIVVQVIDGNTEFGNDPSFSKKANLITISHPTTGEFSQYIHLASGETAVNTGDMVTQGQIISKTGLSGFMDKPHLHFLIFKLTNDQNGFVGLKPNFQTLNS
jgi:murein DD-endopeptidase MepM/ murein hydrolase activator NlpD